MKKNTRAAISFKALKIETKIATFWFGGLEGGGPLRTR